MAGSHINERPGVESPIRMARRPNYDQDKRRKELDRKNKQDAKRLDREQRRLEKADAEAAAQTPAAMDLPD